VNIPVDLATELDALIQQEKAKVPHGKFDRSSVVTGAVREFVGRHLIKEGTHNG
jgi:metal-responsive CopG/Arc/MetJ family transcriptional regulator